VADPLEIRPFSTCVILPNLVVLRLDGTSIKEIRLKKITLRVPTFVITQSHRNRYGSVRHLPINVPQQPWAYFVPFPK